MHLYEAVSAYLQRKDTIAFGDSPNALVTLIVRKILGSLGSRLRYRAEINRRTASMRSIVSG
jgi:hypothetical protein